MSAKDTLITDLKNYFAKGSNGDYSTLAEGLVDLKNAITSYSSKATDTFGNRATGFTGLPFVTAMATLIPTSNTEIPATQFATGLNLSWKAVTLQTTNLPPDAVSITSNLVTVEVGVSTVKPDIKAILDLNFNTVMAGAVPPKTPKEHLEQTLAEMWADVIEKAATETTWTLSYIQNIPPAFPPGTYVAKLLAPV